MTHGKSNNGKQIKIFLSRAADDHEFAVWLRKKLNDNGFTVFDFENDARSGDWVENLSSELNSSDSAVLVINKKWSASPWCQGEASALLRLKNDKNKAHPLTIIPIYLVPMKDITVNAFIGSLASVDFSSTAPYDRKTAFTKLILMLSREDLPPESNPKGTSPFVVFLSLLILLLFLPIAARHWALWSNEQHKKSLQRTQKIAQKIDERVERLIVEGGISAQAAILPEGGKTDYEITYKDPDSGYTLAVDEFVNGRLESRWLYKEGKRIAKDEYSYYGIHVPGHDSVPKVKEKKRQHIDDLGKPYLIDLFSLPEWRLVNKLECKPGEIYHCTEYVLREAPSPPPETVYLPSLYQLPIFYR